MLPAHQGARPGGPPPPGPPHMQGGMKPGMPPMRPLGPGPNMPAGLGQQMGAMNLGPPGPLNQMKSPQAPVSNGYPYSDLQNGPPTGPPSGPPARPPGPPTRPSGQVAPSPHPPPPSPTQTNIAPSPPHASVSSSQPATSIPGSVSHPGASKSPPGLPQPRLSQPNFPASMPTQPIRPGPTQPGIPTSIGPSPRQAGPPNAPLSMPGQPPFTPGMPGPRVPPTSMPGMPNPPTAMPGAPGIPPPSMPGPGMPPTSMPGPGMPPTSMPGPGMPPSSVPSPGMPPTSMPGPGMPPTSVPGPGMPNAPTTSMPGGPGIPPPSMPGPGIPNMPPTSIQGPPGIPPSSMPPTSMPGGPGIPPPSMPGPRMPNMPPTSIQGPPGIPPSSMPPTSMPGGPGMPPTSMPGPGMPNMPPTSMSGPPNMPPTSIQGPPGIPPSSMPRTSMAGSGMSPTSMPGPPSFPPSMQGAPPPSVRPPGPPTQSMAPGGYPQMPGYNPSPSQRPQMPIQRPGLPPGQNMPQGMSPRAPMMPPGPGISPRGPMMPPGPNTNAPQMNKQMPPPGPVNGMGTSGGMQNRYPGSSAPGGPPGGYSQGGQGRRLNPDDMPSPLQVMDEDKQCRSGEFITNMKGQVPPLVTTDFTVRDGGNASPHHLRSTMYSIPHTPEMMKQTHVPFGLVVSPMAQGSGQDSPLYVGTSLENGPVRCNRCKAYMSPLMQFMDGGRKYQCKLCRGVVEVPKEYFCPMDGQGSRADKFQRPELCCGAYEFIATSEYCRDKLLPKEPAFIFVIEMSQLMMQRGVIPLLCQNMKDILEQLPRDTTNGTTAPHTTMRVGFITYQSDVHFYKMNGQAPEMCVVCDREDMFVPVPSGVLCDPREAAQNIEKLMESIPENFKGTRETSGALACAIKAGMEALKAAGRVGKLFVFHSSLPVAGNGALKMREDRKVLGTDREKGMLTPQNSFYNNLGQDLVSAGCSVDLYVFNDTYVDLATVGQVPRLTGGQCYKYAYFQSNKDGLRLLQDLKLNVGREIAFDAVMRVRTSQGVRPVEFFGHFFMSNTTDIELASIDASKGIAIEVKHDDKLTEEDGVYIQAALLYTSCSGQRRLRILNLALTICNQMADLFKSCELDTLMNFFGKQSVVRLLENNAKQVKENLVARTANILACYRKNCASPSSAGQLILPEAMKLLPLYINCLSKSDAVSGGQDLTCDERSWQMYLLSTAPVEASVAYFYPRLLPLTDVDPQSTDFPAPLRTSYDKLHPEGVFLLENGLQMFVWVGSNTPSSWLMDVFGVAAPHQLDPVMAELPDLDNVTSRRIREIVATVRSQRRKHVRMFVVPQQGKHEMIMRNYLVEDKGMFGTASYVDFLCHVHKEIRALLS